MPESKERTKERETGQEDGTSELGQPEGLMPASCKEELATDVEIIHSSALTSEQQDRLAEFLVREEIAISTVYINDEDHAAEVGRAYMEKISGKDSYGFFTAFVDEEPVGLISYSILHPLLRDKAGYDAVLGGDLYVAPENRHMNVGRQLVESVENYFLEKGLQRYSVTVAPTQQTQRFWKRVIPQEYQVRDKGGLLHGAVIPLTKNGRTQGT